MLRERHVPFLLRPSLDAQYRARDIPRRYSDTHRHTAQAIQQIAEGGIVPDLHRKGL